MRHTENETPSDDFFKSPCILQQTNFLLANKSCYTSQEYNYLSKSILKQTESAFNTIVSQMFR